MNRTTKITLTSTFLIAFILRLTAYFVFDRYASPVFWEYHEIALNFLGGRGLSCNFLEITHYAYLEPFYPLLSAFFYKITNYNYLIFGMVNILFSSILTIVVFVLAKNIFTEKEGLLAAFITAIHPGLVYYSTEFHPLTFDALFFTLIVIFLVKLSKTAKLKDAFLVGLFIGLAFLSRTSALIFVPIAVLLVMFLKASAKSRVKLILCVLLVSLSMVAAWTVRNYVVLQKVIVTRSSPGWLLWLGNNPNHTGSAMYTKDKAVISTLDEEEYDKLRDMDELAQNDFFTTRAVEFIKKDPAGFFTRGIKRVYYFWWFSPQSGFFYPQSWLDIYKVFYLFIIVPALLAVFGIGIYRDRMKNVYMPGVFIIIFSCLILSFAQSAFYVEGRHRWVVEPTICILAAWFYVCIFNLLKNRTKVGRI